MMGFRSATRAGLLVLATLVAGCGPMDDPGFASDIERELDRGESHAAALLAATREDPAPEAAIEVAYLERLRLGLGSPFRLMEYALQDPRLPRERREGLAWALLSRTYEGDAYRIDPAALAPGSVTGSRHLELIEGAVGGTSHPDAGALAVRLAYRLAVAEGTVGGRLNRPVAQAAALARDRVLARDDARRLLRAAGNDRDPLSLITVWRVERRFDVEAPSLLAVSQDVEREAIELAPRLLEAIREIVARPRGGPVVPAPETRQRPLLSPAAARVAAVEAARYDAPPQTPVAVAVDVHRRVVDAGGGEWHVRARDRFFENALNEERLAAEYALLMHRTTPDLAVRQAILSAAVGLRAYGQERPWFPGFGGPARRELEDRFGLASIEFPASVPGHWRPYYRRMLEAALSDLHRVLPSLDVRGLNVRFEPRTGSPGTLAVHDPRTRTVYVPAATGAGTLAHEIAHDLDWQTALRRYHVRGDYGTDRAVRLADPRLVGVLQGLSTASLSPSDPPGERITHANRPAEVFARSVDWFVAVALAREGLTNGYLSSVQDDVLTGYGTVTPPDVTGQAGQALVTLLDEVAPVYPDTRRWFLESYGRRRAPTAYDLARRILEAPLAEGEPELLDPAPHEVAVPAADGVAIDTVARVEPQPVRLRRALARMDELEATRDRVLGSAERACRAVAYESRTTGLRRELVAMAAGARARGIAAEVAGEIVGAEGRRWVESRLDGRTRDGLDPVVSDALLELVERVRAISSIGVDAEPGPMATAAVAHDCVQLPFALD